MIAVQNGDLLAGTITDGDIRRGLLRGLTLASPIETILHRDPLVVPPALGAELVLQLMQANKIHQLPIVDDQRHVVGLHVWTDLRTTAARPNPMVIMAGGQGTRLRPHTENCPKPMLPVGGKPMLEHIIERACGEGFNHFVVALHYLGHMIEEYFGNGANWNVRIDYLREREPLGTGGALSLLSPRPEVPFLVTNGDVLTDVRYAEILDFHERHASAATMAVRAHEWQHPFGVVRTQGMDIVGFDEKPVHRTHVNAGIYVLEPRALGVLEPHAHCDMPTLFERLKAGAERTIVYPMHEPWLDVGRPADLEQARSEHA
ncbi:nucleotidyltransferase family protein [Sphingomonas sp. MMS24-J13]|uniref:nucleotidyltransferase family protein n=1 Tax=Sphingomonas sp. MMS24-J13 TaxID=3238686 RepID=UPI0038508685